MPRFPSLLIVCTALGLAGCRPKDPLDWKIHAGSPDACAAWLDRSVRTMPPELQAEFSQAFANVRYDIATRDGMGRIDRANLQLCTHLDGLTVRDVIVEGLNVESNSLSNRITLTADNIIRNIKTSESLDHQPEQERRFAAAVDAQQAAIKKMQARRNEIAARIAQLAPPHAP